VEYFLCKTNVSRSDFGSMLMADANAFQRVDQMRVLVQTKQMLVQSRPEVYVRLLPYALFRLEQHVHDSELARDLIRLDARKHKVDEQLHAKEPDRSKDEEKNRAQDD